MNFLAFPAKNGATIVWTPEEIELFKTVFPNKTYAELLPLFSGKTKAELIRRAKLLWLKKSPLFERRLMQTAHNALYRGPESKQLLEKRACAVRAAVKVWTPFSRQKFREKFLSQPEWRRKLIETASRPEVVAKRIENYRRMVVETDFRERMRTMRQEQIAKDPDYMLRVCKSCKRLPSKPEQSLLELLNTYNLPFKFVGDFTLFIGRKNPDFISTDGSKKLIELFGSRWHPPEDERIRKNHFASFGYETLVIWDYELNEAAKVLRKIQSFARRAPCENCKLNSQHRLDYDCWLCKDCFEHELEEVA